MCVCVCVCVCAPPAYLYDSMLVQQCLCRAARCAASCRRCVRLCGCALAWRQQLLCACDQLCAQRSGLCRIHTTQHTTESRACHGADLRLYTHTHIHTHTQKGTDQHTRKMDTTVVLLWLSKPQVAGKHLCMSVVGVCICVCVCVCTAAYLAVCESCLHQLCQCVYVLLWQHEARSEPPCLRETERSCPLTPQVIGGVTRCVRGTVTAV